MFYHLKKLQGLLLLIRFRIYVFDVGFLMLGLLMLGL